MSNYLALLNYNLTRVNASTINYSTLVGSTIIASSIISNSSINVSSINAQTINYSTLTGSTLTAQTILGTGNVGIGTNNPAAPLHVYGAGTSASYTSYQFSIGNSGPRNMIFGVDGQSGSIQSVVSGTSTAWLTLNPLGGNVGIGTNSPNALLTSFGNSNLGSSSSSITTIAGTLNQTSGAGGGPFMYQVQWDSASTSARQIYWITALNSYTGGPYTAANLFSNFVGIITIYVRNSALTGITMTQYLAGHGAGPTIASLITGTSYNIGTALYTSITFDGASSGNFVLNTNVGGTSPSVQVCWTINAAT